MPNDAAHPRPIHVLVADDDTELCALLTDRLQRLGYTVQSVHNGSQLARALGLLNGDTGAATRPDIILADIYMPGCTGVTVARVVREVGLGIPVVLMTGTAADPWRRSSAGIAEAVLQKPFDAGELDSALLLAMGSGPVTIPEAPCRRRRLTR